MLMRAKEKLILTHAVQSFIKLQTELIPYKERAATSFRGVF